MSAEVTDAVPQATSEPEQQEGSDWNFEIEFRWKAALALWFVLIGPIGHDSVPMPSKAPGVTHQKPAPPKGEKKVEAVPASRKTSR